MRQSIDVHVFIEGQPEPGQISVAEIAHLFEYAIGRETKCVRITFPVPYDDVAVVDGQTLSAAEWARVKLAIANLKAQERARLARATVQ